MTVRMIRIDDGKEGDIHPNEVDTLLACGWRIIEPAQTVVASLSVAKGPRGNWYVMRGKERVSEGFRDEDDAKAELGKIEAGE